MIKTTIITDDIREMVNCSIKNNPVIEPLDLEQHKRFCVGNVTMAVTSDGHIVSYLPDDFTQEQSKLWRADVGGVLVKELRQSEPLLFEHKSEKFKVLLKKIRENELDDFKQRKLVHITVAESDYTIIKVTDITDVLYVKNTKSEKYVVEHPEEETESVYFIELNSVEDEDSNKNESVEYSLF